MPSYSKLRYLAAVLLFVVLNSNAQNINKYFVSNLQPKGVLYFILPQQVFESKEKYCTYDITFLTKSDSVTFNFSIVGDKLELVQALTMSNSSTTISVQAKRLFVESTKKGWVARYSVGIAYADLQKIFNSDSAPSFILQNNNESYALGCKEKRWKKTMEINKKIFQVINYNT